MKHTHSVKGLGPTLAAQMLTQQALDEIRASFKSEKRVYVRAHTRVGPVQWFQNGDDAKALAKAKAAREEARVALAEKKEKGETL